MNKMNTVIITGGTGGIGKALIHQYVQNGYQVVFTYHSKKEAANQIMSKYPDGKVSGYQVNVKNLEEIQKFVENVKRKYGGIDVLINNAGITDDVYFMMMNESRWNNIIDINLGGCSRFTNTVLPYMLEARYGSIINISSVSGIYGQVGQCNYSAAKAGMIGFTKSLAKEMAQKNIRVNAVAPGYIDTQMIHKLSENKLKEIKKNIPMRRFGKPEEIAKVVFFLSSEDASYVSGQVVIVDGGLT